MNDPYTELDVPDLGIFFGAQVGWSPERESGPADRTMAHPVTGEPVVVAVCPECGSGLADRDPIGERMVCGRCMRSAYDGRIAGILAKYPPPKSVNVDRRPASKAASSRNLDADRVREILARRLAGESPTLLGREFGVSDSHIHAIVTGKCWNSVTGIPKWSGPKGGARGLAMAAGSLKRLEKSGSTGPIPPAIVPNPSLAPGRPRDPLPGQTTFLPQADAECNVTGDQNLSFGVPKR